MSSISKSQDPEIRLVDPFDLRRLFNDGRYWESVAEGRILLHNTVWRHPTTPLADEPFCTSSEICALYVHPGEIYVGEVHLYRRPDGRLGASGLPDPKRLLVNGVLYVSKTAEG